MSAPQSIFDIASQYAFAGYAALSPLLDRGAVLEGQHQVGGAGGRGLDGRRGGGDRGAAVDDPGAAAGRACNGLGPGRRRCHHPHCGGDDGAWISPGRADDADVGAPDVHRVARDGGLAARARHAREVRGIDMDRKTWLICVIAAIGFAFDTYELLMLPLIARPALMDLLSVPATDPLINQWVGYLFYMPAVAGGIFGLLGGYLTDRLGRRRVLTWSILLYAFSAFAAGYSTSVYQLLFWRCCTFVGVCVEFVAAVAWLAELFTDPKQREAVIGYTQAFGSLGGLMVTAAYHYAVTNAASFPAVHGGHEAWRYTLMSGVIPAIPLIVIRPFLPESPVWREKKAAGTLKRPSFGELFQPQFARTTIVTTIMMACVYGAAFGAIQQMPRIVPGLPEVRGLARPAIEQTVSARAVLPGIRRPRRTDPARLPRGPHPQPPQAAARLPDPGDDPAADPLRHGADQQRRNGEVGTSGGRPADDRAVQLLGELSAARLSGPFARHGRELRGQRRRPHDRHVGGAGDDEPGRLDARRHARGQARLRGGARRHDRLRDRLHRQLLAAGTGQGRSAGIAEIFRLKAEATRFESGSWVWSLSGSFRPSGGRSQRALVQHVARRAHRTARGLCVPVHCVAASAASAGMSAAAARRSQSACAAVRASCSRARRASPPRIAAQAAAPRSDSPTTSAFQRTTCGQHDGDRDAVRRAVLRGQRIRAGVRRAEHRQLDRGAGEVGAAQHRAAGRDVARRCEHALVVAARAAARPRAASRADSAVRLFVTNASTACEIAS